MMSTAESNELSNVLDRVKSWSPPLRIALARRILETLDTSDVGRTEHHPPIVKPTRGVPVERVLGMLKTDREPPSDEECRRIVEEERWKKYGPETS
jgi:hypothetical protein